MREQFQISKYYFRPISIRHGLHKRDAELLGSNMSERHEKKGAIIYRQGSYSKGIYILRKGKVKIYQNDQAGTSRIVYVYSRGEAMGYRPLICEEPHPVTAETLENCTISFIPRRYFLRAINASPQLANKLLINLSHEFSVWVNILIALHKLTVKGRTALILLILNEKYRKEGRTHTTVRLTRKDIASYAGTTLESVVRVLRKFKDKQIIAPEGKEITILDRSALVREVHKV